MKIENGLPCSQLPEAPPQTGLQFTVATEEDFDDIMAMSKDIYGGLDYLPSRYQAWLQESNRTVILARKQGKVVRKRTWRDFPQCLLYPHSFRRIVHPKWKSFIHPHVIPISYDFLFWGKHVRNIQDNWMNVLKGWFHLIWPKNYIATILSFIAFY